MATVPRTEIEIGAVCPPAFVAAGGECAVHQSVTVLFQWVCPGAEGVNSNICPGSGFEVNLSVNGKLAFSADAIPINGNSPAVPAAPCPRGYLREFLCWDQVSLASDSSDPQGTGPINTNLTQAFMQTRKGIVIAGPAQKIPELGISDAGGPVTLVGLVETIEGTAANSFQERKYDFNMSTNGIPVP